MVTFPYHGEEGDFESLEALYEATNTATELCLRERECELRQLVARHEIDRGDPKLGAQHCSRVIGMLLEDQPWDNAEVMVSRGMLAEALIETGTYGQAESLLIDLIVDRERVHGADDPRTLISRGTLVKAVSGGGRPHEALVLAEALLADRVRLLGEDHPSTLDTRGHIGQIHSMLGNHELAAATYRQLLDDRMRVLSPDDSVIAQTRLNVAIVSARIDVTDTALEVLEQCRLELEQRFGGLDAGTLRAQSAIVEQLCHMHRFEEALNEAGALIAARTRLFGAFAAQTVNSHLWFVSCLTALQRHDQAYDHLRGLSAATKEVLGPQFAQTFSVRVDYLDLLLALELLDEAVIEMHDLRNDVLHLEPDHPIRRHLREVQKVLDARPLERVYAEGSFLDDDREDDEERDEQALWDHAALDGLPYAENPRLVTGRRDGRPGEMILVVAADLIPPYVNLCTVEADGYLPDDLYDEIARLRGQQPPSPKEPGR